MNPFDNPKFDPDNDPRDADRWGGSGRTRREREAEERATRQGARASEDDETDCDEALGLWDAGDDDYIIPPRGWLLGKIFCRRFLSSLIADGGVGKTAVRVVQLISLAIGWSLTGEHVFQRCRVLIVSLEDDKDELRRRVYAVMRHYGIQPEDVKGRLFLAAPKHLKLARMVEGSPDVGELDRILRDTIARHGIDLVPLDPFVKSHLLPENDNGAIDFVTTLLATIGIDLDCAIDTPHRTAKGIAATPGDANRGRGATSMKDAGRLVSTLTPMTPEEAKGFGLTEADRPSFVRMDSAKVNIAPPSREAKWFRIVSVPLGNATDLYPAGDHVQAVEPWDPPEVWEGISAILANSILDDLDKGLDNGSRYSTSPSAIDRAAWRVVVQHVPKTDKQARSVIKTWIDNGLLMIKDYHDPEARRDLKGVFVNPLKRPS